MQKCLWFLICMALAFCVFGIIDDSTHRTQYYSHPGEPEVVKLGSLTKIWTCNTDSSRTLSIRVLILRHANESMAVGDARLVENAVSKASSKGLDIKVVGNVLVQSLDEFSQALNSHVTKNSQHGDTLIVHTIGHGHGSGRLQNLGQREGVFRELVSAASANRQEMLWWQLSCHAAARLPDINSIEASERSLFSNLASSSASKLSAAGVQGRIMEKVFVAMAEKSSDIDPDGDEVITADELKNFLNGLDSSRRGDLLFAQSGNEVIFGGYRPWELPIIDRMGTPREYDPRFIPVPRNPIPTRAIR